MSLGTVGGESAEFNYGGYWNGLTIVYLCQGLGRRVSGGRVVGSNVVVFRLSDLTTRTEISLSDSVYPSTRQPVHPAVSIRFNFNSTIKPRLLPSMATVPLSQPKSGGHWPI
jgi:hypothetical protein